MLAFTPGSTEVCKGFQRRLVHREWSQCFLLRRFRFPDKAAGQEDETHLKPRALAAPPTPNTRAAGQGKAAFWICVVISPVSSNKWACIWKPIWSLARAAVKGLNPRALPNRKKRQDVHSWGEIPKDWSSGWERHCCSWLGVFLFWLFFNQIADGVSCVWDLNSVV